MSFAESAPNAPVKTGHRWFAPRYRLRTLLILMTAVCVVLAMGPYKARRYDQRKARAQEMISSLGGTAGENVSSREPSPGTNWISRQLGYGERRESLWRVDLSKKSLSDDHLKQLGECNWIHSLNLSGSDVRDESLKHIATMRKLRELSLAETGITDAGLANLKALERLHVLDVHLTKATYAGLAELDQAFPGANFQEQFAISRATIAGVTVSTTLRYGSIEPDMYVPSRIPVVRGIHFRSSRSQLTPQNVEDLRHLTSVQSVDFSQEISPPDGPSLLSSWTDLESFSIVDVRDYRSVENDLIQLVKLPKLKRLILTGDALTDESVAHLADVHQLQSLTLFAAQVTPSSLVHLRGLKGLQRLTISFRRDRDAALNPQAAAAAREGLKHLAAMPSLRHLRISGDLVNDELAGGFAELKSLETLEFDGRHVSAEAVEALETALPDCLIKRNQR